MHIVDRSLPSSLLETYVMPVETAEAHHDRTHDRLMAYGRQRLSPATPDACCADPALEAELVAAEVHFIEQERAAIRPLAACAPTDAAGFIGWWETLRDAGPGQDDPLFCWLESEADLEAMRWFVYQELVGEAGFDDLLALTQLRMPVTAKLEMARNYWDEMGRGRAHAMHGPLLDRTGQILEIDDLSSCPIVWPSRALANLMVGLAFNRRYAYHSVGALGVVELTAPGRTRKVANGLKRLGLPKEASYYFALHATVDLAHSDAWVKNVLTPLVEEDASRAQWIAEGALMRLNAGARCFDRYRAHFGLGGPQAYVAKGTDR